MNNSGMGAGGVLADMDLESWENVINLNLNMVFYMTQRCIPYLEGAATVDDPASIIMLGSTDALRVPNQTNLNYPYSASKAALHWFTKHAAIGLGAKYIT